MKRLLIPIGVSIFLHAGVYFFLSALQDHRTLLPLSLRHASSPPSSGIPVTSAPQESQETPPLSSSAAASMGGREMSVGEKDFHLVTPAYPELSRRAGEEGVVEVLWEPQPRRASVVASSGFARLDAAALRAAQNTPASTFTRTQRLRYVFRLSEAPTVVPQ